MTQDAPPVAGSTGARPARGSDALAGLALAVTLLSVVPLRGVRRTDRAAAGWAMTFAPLVGLGIGLTCDASMFLCRVLLDPVTGSLIPAVVGLGTLALLTRGLHLDGLADVADGLGAGPDRERSLAAMRDSSVGAFGVAAVVFVLLGQVTTLAQAVMLHHGTVSLLLAVVTGRTAAMLACVEGLRGARSSGLGATVAGTVPRARAAIALVSVLAVAVVAGRIDYDGGRLLESVRAVAAVLVGLGAALLLRRRAARRFGGITGDVLGAMIEVAALAVLVVMSTRVPHVLVKYY